MVRKMIVTMSLRKALVWLVLLIAALALAACGAGTTEFSSPQAGEAAQQTQQVSVAGGGSYTDVGPDGLAAMLESKDFPFINVHIPYEGEIAGTDQFIPYNEIDRHLDKLPADKDARVVLYCRSGNMSATAARQLVELGYTDVWNLDGGMIAWEQAGYPLLSKNQ